MPSPPFAGHCNTPLASQLFHQFPVLLGHDIGDTTRIQRLGNAAPHPAIPHQNDLAFEILAFGIHGQLGIRFFPLLQTPRKGGVLEQPALAEPHRLQEASSCSIGFVTSFRPPRRVRVQRVSVSRKSLTLSDRAGPEHVLRLTSCSILPSDIATPRACPLNDFASLWLACRCPLSTLRSTPRSCNA